MPPENATATAAVAGARDTLALWRELAAAYDAIEGSLARAAWGDVATLAARVAALEATLQPMLDAPRNAEDRALWSEVDAFAAALAARQPRTLRAATAARDAVAARLARALRSRAGAARYRGARPELPLFASKLA